MKMLHTKHLSIVLTALALLPSCASTSRSIAQTGPIIGTIEAANDHLIDIQLGPQRISGEGQGLVILSFLTLGVSDYAEGMTLEASGDSGGIGNMVGNAFGAISSFLPAGGLDKVKSEALRDACDKANCDILAYPVYYIEESGFSPIYANYTVEVQGFPGMIKGASNVARTVEKGVTPFPGVLDEHGEDATAKND